MWKEALMWEQALQIHDWWRAGNIRFRIMAETAIGRSDPLVTDSPIKARDQSSMERRNIGNEWEERSGGWGLNLSLTIYYLL